MTLQELTPYLNYAALALAALILVYIMVAVYRMFTRRARGRKGMRIGISEYCEIDQSRRLVLVRRDDVEHLIMIGGSQDLVVESGIGTGLAEALAARDNETEPPSVVPLRAPRPPVFGAKRRPMLHPVSPSFEDDEQNPA